MLTMEDAGAPQFAFLFMRCCGGFNDTCPPQAQVFEHVVPSGQHSLETVRNCSLAGGRRPLQG